MWVALVRHAQVAVEPETPSFAWELSDEGRAAARALGRGRLWRRTPVIYTSPEFKAHETAQIVAGPHSINVVVVEDLREVERGWIDDAYPGGYASAVRDWMARPDQPVHGWETATAARKRMRACIDELRKWERGRPFAVVGHGLTLSLYYSALTGDDPAVIWPRIGFPDLAVVEPEGGRVRRGFSGLVS